MNNTKQGVLLGLSFVFFVFGSLFGDFWCKCTKKWGYGTKKCYFLLTDPYFLLMKSF